MATYISNLYFDSSGWRDDCCLGWVSVHRMRRCDVFDRISDVMQLDTQLSTSQNVVGVVVVVVIVVVVVVVVVVVLSLLCCCCSSSCSGDKVNALINTGVERVKLHSDGSLVDNSWQTVIVRKVDNRVSIKLNNGRNIIKILPGSLFNLNLNDHLYLGGHRHLKSLTKHIGSEVSWLQVLSTQTTRHCV